MSCTEKIRIDGKLVERPCQGQQQPSLRGDVTPVSFLEKVKNFAVAAAQHVAAGMPTASDEEMLRRYEICSGCEFFRHNSCAKCGCPVYRDKKFVSKLGWADQSCPIGKWGPEAPSGGDQEV